MNWRWDWLWSIFWNAFLHAVFFQWSSLAQDGESLKSWWRSLWSEIENRVNDVRSWASRRISWLQGYAAGLYYQALVIVYRIEGAVRSTIDQRISSLWTWASGRISWLQGYALGLYYQALNVVYGIRSQIEAALRPYVDAAISWVRSLYKWIQPYRELISGWLVQARSAVDWLWHHAWRQLQAFLANPLHFVLGWLIDPIRNAINWWQQYGPLLANFAANQLPSLLNLLAAGFSLLRRFVDRPAETILELIADTFVDWAAGVIADRW